MILVVQFREDASREHEQECISLHVPDGQSVRFVSVFDPNVNFEQPAILLKGVEKLILGGSGAFGVAPNHPGNDDEKAKFVLKTVGPLVEYVLQEDFPTLGACFGHQLLGLFAGGRVTFDQEQAETGFVEISRNDVEDKILRHVPRKFFAIIGHEDSVVDLPESAVVLASSERCPVQLVRFGNQVYGAQFHSELNAKQLAFRLSLFPHYRKNAKSLSSVPTPHAVQILENFLTIPVTAKV